MILTQYLFDYVCLILLTMTAKPIRAMSALKEINKK